MVNLFRPRKTTPRLERLRNLGLFVNLTPAELEIVDGLLHERDYLFVIRMRRCGDDNLFYTAHHL